ncbi:MAG: hypothetical protein U5K00_08175 [Melioribacteraceae bacterium]|nr:hypothetical protein [Melioribacteraceae bacterium]
MQKNKPISKEESTFLRKKNLVEGRYPNIYISSNISRVSGDKSSYIKNLAFDKKYYKDLVINFINEYNEATRAEINELLINKISDVLTTEQKRRKIKNLLYEMAHKDHQSKILAVTNIPNRY